MCVLFVFGVSLSFSRSRTVANYNKPAQGVQRNAEFLLTLMISPMSHFGLLLDFSDHILERWVENRLVINLIFHPLSLTTRSWLASNSGGEEFPFLLLALGTTRFVNCHSIAEPFRRPYLDSVTTDSLAFDHSVSLLCSYCP